MNCNCASRGVKAFRQNPICTPVQSCTTVQVMIVADQWRPRAPQAGDPRRRSPPPRSGRGRGGLDELTADRIAEEAGVSRRTLFNYFPRVEDVLTASLEAVTAETIDAIVDRPADEPLRTRRSWCSRRSDRRAGVRPGARAGARCRLAPPPPAASCWSSRTASAPPSRRACADRLGADADPIYVASLAAAASARSARVTRLAVAASSDEAHGRRAPQGLDPPGHGAPLRRLRRGRRRPRRVPRWRTDVATLLHRLGLFSARRPSPSCSPGSS